MYIWKQQQKQFENKNGIEIFSVLLNLIFGRDFCENYTKFPKNINSPS